MRFYTIFPFSLPTAKAHNDAHRRCLCVPAPSSSSLAFSVYSTHSQLVHLLKSHIELALNPKAKKNRKREKGKSAGKREGKSREKRTGAKRRSRYLDSQRRARASMERLWWWHVTFGDFSPPGLHPQKRAGPAPGNPRRRVQHPAGISVVGCEGPTWQRRGASTARGCPGNDVSVARNNGITGWSTTKSLRAKSRSGLSASYSWSWDAPMPRGARGCPLPRTFFFFSYPRVRADFIWIPFAAFVPPFYVGHLADRALFTGVAGSAALPSHLRGFAFLFWSTERDRFGGVWSGGGLGFCCVVGRFTGFNLWIFWWVGFINFGVDILDLFISWVLV